MTDKKTDLRVFVDTEYCYPGMEKGTPRPTSKDLRQIVQIAAVIYDMVTGVEVKAFDQLAIPAYDKKLVPFFTELTDITQEMVDRDARDYRDVLADFVAFCEGYSVWTFDKDEEVFRQNCGYFEIDFPFVTSFTRVKPLLPGWGVDPSQYSSGSLYKAAGLQLGGHVHNALHDVRSMAASVRFFESEQSY